MWVAWAERGLVELTPDLRDAWAFPNAGAAARAAGLIRHLIPDLGLHAVAASSLIHRAVDDDIANHAT